MLSLRTAPKRNMVLFFLYYALFLGSLFLADLPVTASFWGALIKGMKLGAFGICFLTGVSRLWNQKSLWLLIGCVAVGGLVLVATGDFFCLIALTIGVVAQDIEEKDIFKITLLLVGIGTLAVVFLNGIGMLPDVLSRRDDFSAVYRHSYGFFHSNILPLNVFYCLCYYVMWQKNRRPSRWIWVGALAISVVLYKLCGSRNALIGVFLVVADMVLMNIRGAKKLHRIGNEWLAYLMLPFCWVLSFVPMILRAKGKLMALWVIYDKIFTNRSLLGASAVQHYGIRLINTMSYEEYASQKVMVDGFQWTGLVLDNGFAYMLVRYGILVVLLFGVLYFAWLHLKKEDAVACGLVAVILFVNMTDNDLFSFGFLPFMIIGIRGLLCLGKKALLPHVRR